MRIFKSFVKETPGGLPEVSRILGINYQTLYAYYVGKRLPRPDIAEKIERKSGGKVPKESWYWKAA